MSSVNRVETSAPVDLNAVCRWLIERQGNPARFDAGDLPALDVGAQPDGHREAQVDHDEVVADQHVIAVATVKRIGGEARHRARALASAVVNFSTRPE